MSNFKNMVSKYLRIIQHIKTLIRRCKKLMNHNKKLIHRNKKLLVLINQFYIRVTYVILMRFFTPSQKFHH